MDRSADSGKQYERFTKEQKILLKNKSYWEVEMTSIAKMDYVLLISPIEYRKKSKRNADHRTSIVASLIKGANILEYDHHQNRQGPDALAPPWWESFHFYLIHKLVDDTDRSIFGAIYEYEFPNYSTTSTSHNHNPPKYGIAFQGTIVKRQSIIRDVILDLRVILNSLNKTSYFRIDFQVVQNIVEINHGVTDIWLADHSLGSAIALNIGRGMVKRGIRLETYLFNPPFASLPIEIIKNDILKHGICGAHSVNVILYFIVDIMSSTPYDNDGTFTQLCGWILNLFVNPSDPICSKYVGYFEHREKMIEFSAEGIVRIAI
ncbi:GDSL esterase/lipase At4g10955-like [Lycium ferocissimum]|uniref:GDSL esterase/lipase At4g10955-like n=1 Tax=Lycium ferocissimum TaxID=112874 RepID=UPI0028159A42|nr:GDSL esterase/lipase At4g10955-like [Lycium ferocissimum]